MATSSDKYTVSIRNASLRLINADICDEQVDAIVNAANEELSHGGGLAASISRRGGPVINSESSQWINQNGRVLTGKVAYTKGGNLHAKYVIHAVGPVYRNGKRGEKGKLISCVRESLLLGEKLEVQSISFPAISSGIFGYPKEESADVIMKCIARYLYENREKTIPEVRITIIDKLTYDIFRGKFKQLFLKQELRPENFVELDDSNEYIGEIEHSNKIERSKDYSHSEGSFSKNKESRWRCGCIIM